MIRDTWIRHSEEEALMLMLLLSMLQQSTAYWHLQREKYKTGTDRLYLINRTIDIVKDSTRKKVCLRPANVEAIGSALETEKKYGLHSKDYAELLNRLYEYYQEKISNIRKK